MDGKDRSYKHLNDEPSTGCGAAKARRLPVSLDVRPILCLKVPYTPQGFSAPDSQSDFAS
jgi:hypothetical protein